MKKGQIIEGMVERVDFPNKGIVNTAEGICTVKNVLPGQKITLMVQKNRNKKAEGRALSVDQKSPLEIVSPCPHFGECGGCTYISLPYEEQLAIKEAQVKKLLDSVLDRQEEDWEFQGIKGSPEQYEYRNKMEFSFGDAYKDGPLSLGMHKRGSFYDIVSVSDCQIVDEDYRKILVMTQEHFKDCSFYHRLRHEGFLRHLLVRKAKKTGQILVALVTTSEGIPDVPGENACNYEIHSENQNGIERKNPDSSWNAAYGKQEHEQLVEEWKEKLLAMELHGTMTGILHIINDSVADVVQSDETRVLYGQEYIEEELLGLKFKISTFSFFQTNSLGAEVLYETAREYVGDLTCNKDKEVVFDLYSGTGTIAQLMAPVAKKVIGVEIVEEAVEAAKKNAELNGLHNCEFVAGDVLKVLDDITEKPDMIILDPPRDGIHPKALTKIIAYGIPRLVYISCKPTSLIRDLETFLASGYHVEKAVAVDQFPWTANVETVVLLSHKKPDGHINVKVEFGEGEGKVPLDNIAKRAESYKPKERVTYKMIKEYIEAKYGFKVHTAYIAEVKRDLGLPMYDAPNAVFMLKEQIDFINENKCVSAFGSVLCDTV